MIPICPDNRFKHVGRCVRGRQLSKDWFKAHKTSSVFCAPPLLSFSVPLICWRGAEKRKKKEKQPEKEREMTGIGNNSNKETIADQLH
jgi:hypothetical protein